MKVLFSQLESNTHIFNQDMLIKFTGFGHMVVIQIVMIYY